MLIAVPMKLPASLGRAGNILNGEQRHNGSPLENGGSLEFNSDVSGKARLIRDRLSCSDQPFERARSFGHIIVGAYAVRIDGFHRKNVQTKSGGAETVDGVTAPRPVGTLSKHGLLDERPHLGAVARASPHVFS